MPGNLHINDLLEIGKPFLEGASPEINDEEARFKALRSYTFHQMGNFSGQVKDRFGKDCDTFLKELIGGDKFLWDALEESLNDEDLVIYDHFLHYDEGYSQGEVLAKLERLGFRPKVDHGGFSSTIKANLPNNIGHVEYEVYYNDAYSKRHDHEHEKKHRKVDFYFSDKKLEWLKKPLIEEFKIAEGIVGTFYLSIDGSEKYQNFLKYRIPDTSKVDQAGYNKHFSEFTKDELTKMAKERLKGASFSEETIDFLSKVVIKDLKADILNIPLKDYVLMELHEGDMDYVKDMDENSISSSFFHVGNKTLSIGVKTPEHLGIVQKIMQKY